MSEVKCIEVSERRAGITNVHARIGIKLEMLLWPLNLSCSLTLTYVDIFFYPLPVLVDGASIRSIKNRQ